MKVNMIGFRVSKFREPKNMGNKAKLNEKDAKQNSKLARPSETKRNKVRLRQFRFHEPLTTKTKHMGNELLSHVSLQK
jgi:hypothetical protein